MEKRGLGKGLAALISETMSESGAGQVSEIPVEQIQPNPFQPRVQIDPIKLDEMTASIREMGILQPLLVRRVAHERFELVAGERRYRAAIAAGLKKVPALIKDITEQEQLEMAIVENVQREDIGAIESARAYRRLIDEFNMTQETVSQRVGKSRSAIANTLRLLNLPQPVLESLERGELSEGHGRAIMSAETPEQILETWKQALSKKLSVRDTEKLARQLRESSAPSTEKSAAVQDAIPNPPADPNLLAAIDQLQRQLGTRIDLKLRPGGQGGSIVIDYYTSDDLNRLLDLLIIS